MAKRLTQKQKEEIIKLFTSGINIDLLSKQFDCTKQTIQRNLKKKIGEDNYNLILIQSKSNKKLIKSKNSNKENKLYARENNHLNEDKRKDSQEGIFLTNSEFVEIAPLKVDIDNAVQKDITSLSISQVKLPKTVYMIVDKKIEIETKYLKDYPQWQFLSRDELERKTIEIFFDLKIAKSFCQKEQKVIKVPNTNVFKIVAPILCSRGISRIVSADKLIAL